VPFWRLHAAARLAIDASLISEVEAGHEHS
jgi:hypothetical protein